MDILLQAQRRFVEASRVSGANVSGRECHHWQGRKGPVKIYFLYYILHFINKQKGFVIVPFNSHHTNLLACLEYAILVYIKRTIPHQNTDLFYSNQNHHKSQSTTKVPTLKNPHIPEIGQSEQLILYNFYVVGNDLRLDMYS